jgi:hypothetical protein
MASPAYAYRPFDSTDAAVADKGAIELEFGPVGYIVDTDGRFLIAPEFRFNFGMTDRWEVVLEGRHFWRVDPVDEGRRNTLRDTALSVKGMIRQGSLQERQGPSVAVELGVLLPGVGLDPGIGASFAGIVSQQWPTLTLHVNGEFVIAHDHTVGVVIGAIVEGPSRWPVRPATEIVVDRAIGHSVYVLAGGIWQLRSHLSLDAGWRLSRVGGIDVREIRAGFTWAFPVTGSSEARRPAPPDGLPIGPSTQGPRSWRRL